MNTPRILTVLVVPAHLFLSACASNPPAPVSELTAPASTPQASSPRYNKPLRASSAAPRDVVVTALANPDSSLSAPTAKTSDLQEGQLEASTDWPGTTQLNPAVVSLLNRANAYQRNGEYARSAESIERALTIEPNNAWLWHRLATARFQQGKPGQAAALAAKSNTLIGQDRNPRQRELMATNWQLIASVHKQRGENVAAKAAARRARLIRAGAG